MTQGWDFHWMWLWPVQVEVGQNKRRRSHNTNTHIVVDAALSGAPAQSLPSVHWSESEAVAHWARRLVTVGCRDGHWVGARKLQSGDWAVDGSGLNVGFSSSQHAGVAATVRGSSHMVDMTECACVPRVQMEAD